MGVRSVQRGSAPRTVGLYRLALCLGASAPLLALGAAPLLAARYESRAMPLEGVHARPISLALADFDADGVVDLAVGSADGTVSILRGNGALAWPRADGLADGAEAFGDRLGLARLDARPDLLAAGDFDADGVPDLVVATRGGDLLYWLSGDGRGGLSAPGAVPLGAPVTALAAGEVNRADGLADLAVAVDDGAEPGVLVFEGALGARNAEPERISLPAAATRIAFGRFGAGPWLDLAVAGGDTLTIVGRDRRTSQPRREGTFVSAPVVESFSFGSPIAGLAAADLLPDRLGRAELSVRLGGGSALLLQREIDPRAIERPRLEAVVADLAGLPRLGGETPDASAAARSLPINLSGSVADRALSSAGTEWLRTPAVTSETPAGEPWSEQHAPLAAVSARLDSDGTPDWVIADPADSSLQLLLSAPVVTYMVNSSNDVNDGTCNGTHCSLREAILAANASGGEDAIHFAIAGTGPHTIALASFLPSISERVTIDGYTQSGAAANADGSAFTGTVGIVLDGSGLAGTGDALNVGASGGGSVIRGLAIANFPDDGIALSSGGNFIEGNLIGLLADGSTAAPIADNAIELWSGSNTIGGTAPAARNVIAGDATTWIFAYENGGHTIQGNLVGLNAAGTAGVGTSSLSGMLLQDSASNTVGGTAAGARNVVGGAGQAGICLCSFDDGVSGAPDATGNLVQGNYAGTNAAGSAAIGNATGLAVQDAATNTIGGTTASARNLLSGSTYSGVFVATANAILTTTGNTVEGNYIGTSADGLSALPNSNGVSSYNATLNTIGGATAASANLISGNTFNGVLLDYGFGGSTTMTSVEWNYIGVDSTFASPLGNGTNGVFISDSTDNIVSDNLIDFNGAGVILDAPTAPSTGNTVQFNSIDFNVTSGIDLSAADSNYFFANSLEANPVTLNDSDLNSFLSNDVSGSSCDAIALYQTATGCSGNVFDGNLLFENGCCGIWIPSPLSVGNTITENWMYDNGLCGIDLGFVTTNDGLDADSGPNNLQNYPTLDPVAPGGTMLTGDLHSTASSSFTVEIFKSDVCNWAGYGEGKTFQIAKAVATDGAGDGSFSHTFGAPLAEGEVITATATDDVTGDTSEFSRCREVCTPVKNLGSQTVSTETTFMACDTITAGSGGFTVDATGIATFRAGVAIALEDGFTVDSGGVAVFALDGWLASSP